MSEMTWKMGALVIIDNMSIATSVLFRFNRPLLLKYWLKMFFFCLFFLQIQGYPMLFLSFRGP